MKKNRINTFYALNILTILDGEILECAGTPITQYADLDISTEKDRNIILEDLLRPELLHYSPENQHKIRLSFLYCTTNCSETQLEDLLNFYSGSIFPTPNSKITYKEFFEIMYTSLFCQNIEVEELDHFMFYDGPSPHAWNLFKG